MDGIDRIVPYRDDLTEAKDTIMSGRSCNLLGIGCVTGGSKEGKENMEKKAACKHSLTEVEFRDEW